MNMQVVQGRRPGNQGGPNLFNPNPLQGSGI